MCENAGADWLPFTTLTEQRRGIHLKASDDRYARILLKAIAVCQNYKPKFGAGGDGQTLGQFQTLYGADPFYAWMGLDSPLMYSAHTRSIKQSGAFAGRSPLD